MIYLIKSACFKDVNDINCTEYETILKIGYTRDDRASIRLATYRTENPGAISLYSIPEGDEQDERNLHYHFRKYKKYGSEWFSYEQEILDFFKTHTTKESLKELKPYHGRSGGRIFNKYYKEFNRLIPILTKKYISKVLSSIKVSDKYLETIETLEDKLCELLENSLDLDKVDNYFKTVYPDINFEKEPSISTEVSSEINKIEKLSHFTDKIKYIYKLSYSSDFMKLLLDNLADPSFAKYYYTIPKERAGTLNYVKGNLEKEYKSIKSFSINQDKLLDEIEEAFIVGEKYTKSYIKETLRTIYENNGYNKTPKASDLEEYFEIKLCKVLDKTTGKSDNGFKIIKLKTEEK